MRFIGNKKGFSLVELLIASVVLTVGLTGVAALQINAIGRSFFANSFSTGGDLALAWTEFVSGLVASQGQDKLPYLTSTGPHLRWNFVKLASIDGNPNDTLGNFNPNAAGFNPGSIGAPFVTIKLPATTAALVQCFNGLTPFTTSTGGSVTVQFEKPGGGLFTAQDMPPPAPPGSSLTMSVAANVPVVNAATLIVSLIYKNAFLHGRGPMLTSVVSSNM